MTKRGSVHNNVSNVKPSFLQTSLFQNINVTLSMTIQRKRTIDTCVSDSVAEKKQVQRSFHLSQGIQPTPPSGGLPLLLTPLPYLVDSGTLWFMTHSPVYPLAFLPDRRKQEV